MTGAGRYHLIAHTADIGLEASAPTLAGLFVAAAEGFKDLVYGDTPVRMTVRHAVCLEADDVAGLMVVWLNELLYLGESGRLVPANFTIDALDGQNLSATIGGEPFAPGRHTIERIAKAVTYHQLVVEERDGGWYARVYIDL